MNIGYRKLFLVSMGLVVSTLLGTAKTRMVDSIELAPEDSYKANEHLWWNHAGTLTENWEGQVFHFGNRVRKQAVKHYYGLDDSWSTIMIANV